jgi:hypothetical protein
MIHSFQTEIAEECGVEAAIIFANIQHWIKHNSANGINVRDGHIWTYNSRAAWCEQFPYMGEKQIRNAIEALVQAGFVIRGNFSGGNVNRTYWYRLAERAEAFSLNGQTKFGRKGQTITDDKPDEKQTIPPTPRGEPDGFEEIWKVVWKRGGGSQPRQPAARAYAAAIKNGAKHEVILAAVKARIGVDKPDTVYAPMLSTWLNQRRWENEGAEPVMSAADLDAANRRLEERQKRHREQMAKLAEERSNKLLGLAS